MENEDSTNINAILRMNRRTFVKMAGVTAGAVALGVGLRSAWAQLPPDTNCGIKEYQPYVTSPFIMRPFIDALPIPIAMAPGWRPDPTITGTQVPWTVRYARYLGVNPDGTFKGPGVVTPGPNLNQQDCYGHMYVGDKYKNYQGIEQPVAAEHYGTHQVWPVPLATPPTLPDGTVIGGHFDRLINWPKAGVAPILYHIRYQFRQHSFTSSPVGVQVDYTDPVTGKVIPKGTIVSLPDSAIYGFNGTFPGPMINVEYGKPIIVRFENDLNENPYGLDRQDFGAPDYAVLTHLHNGHTAAEGDGQPHYMQLNDGGYTPGDWIDSLYINYPAGGDPSEIQSFLWFHDHRMHFTGANVYKGQVGLMPHYDPGYIGADGKMVGGLDTGNESDPKPNLKLPGVRTNNPDGTFDVKYDIPMAFYDVALDDGVSLHLDMHTVVPLLPSGSPDCNSPEGKGIAHPEWWGKTFFKHWPNHGFVGDIFTVNGKAYPVLHVSPRRYRFRFLDASVSRIYELCLMTSANGPVAMRGTQGQWQIPDGVQWLDGTAKPKSWVRVASMGGLLPNAIVTNTVHIWPASRREVVVDFSKAAGKTIYLTNILYMPDGRKPNFNDLTKPIDGLPYKVPLVQIIVDGPSVPDNSAEIVDGTKLRDMPRLASGQVPTLANTSTLPQKSFTLTRGGPDDESQWIINGLPFNALSPMAIVVRDRPEVWTNTNGGGGWVHPMHMHMEEHKVLARIGSTLAVHPDDTGKEDVTNLEPSESVTYYRNFRTFTGRYVAHCHNLAHEDHNMMFGWSIADVGGQMDINGSVTKPGGAPLKDVTMNLSGPGRVESVLTDAKGKYGFTGLVTGDYTITPSSGKYTFVPTSKTVHYVSGTDQTGVDFVGIK